MIEIGALSFTFFYILVILNCADAAMTIYGVKRGHEELNPLIRSKTDNGVIIKILLLKLVMLLFVFFIASSEGATPEFLSGLISLSLFYSGVVGWNLAKLHNPVIPPIIEEAKAGMV